MKKVSGNFWELKLLIEKEVIILKQFKYFALGLLLGVLIVGTVSAVKAYLTKQKVLGGSTISTATLDLATTPQSALINFQGVLPGFDSGEQKVTLKNTGTANLKYRVSIEPLGTLDNNTLYENLGYTLYEYDENSQVTKTHGGGGFLLKNLQNLDISETLNSGQEKELGLKVSLPQDANNGIQGLTTNFKIIFNAIQEDGVF